MIEKWKAKIRAEIPGNPECASDNYIRWFLFDNFETRFPKIFYFFKNKIQDPVILWVDDKHLLHLHPGICRYIGRSLKSNDIWLDSIIYFKNTEFVNTSIILIDCLEKIKMKSPEEASFLHHDRHDYVKRGETYRNCLLSHSNNSCIEIITESGKKYVWNSAGEKIMTFYVKDYHGMIPTLRHIFNTFNDQ